MERRRTHLLPTEMVILPETPGLVTAGADDQDAELVPVTFDSLQKGDKVRIQSLDAVGEVIGKMPDKNRLVVLTNMMKVEVRPEDLEMVSKK